MKLSIPLIILSALFYFGKCGTARSIPTAQAEQQSVYTFRPPSADGIGKVYFGREIAHVMGAGGAQWLERNSRQLEENTALAIEKMELQPTDVVADIGAGTGYYTFKIAQKVPQGKVYAVEIQDEMIRYLNNRIQQGTTKNVEVIKSNVKSPNLPDSSIDMAIMVDVYHELKYPHEMLQAIRKALKSGGKLLLLEYKAEDPSVAIKPLHKMTTAQAAKELGANGFELLNRGDFLPIQHFLLFRKK